MNESMFSQIDLIRQDSKDVRDFVKKVFSDREFKSMSKDTDFIKYLKSIYEGTHLDEEHVKFSNRTQNGTITTGSVQITNETIKEDQDCWDTHKVGNPKTKISSKTGKRVNNCVPKSESVVNEAKEPEVITQLRKIPNKDDLKIGKKEKFIELDSPDMGWTQYYNDKLFTGTSIYFRYEDDEEVLDGWEEETYLEGISHGEKKEFNQDGQLTLLEINKRHPNTKYSSVISSKKYSKNGNLIEDFFIGGQYLELKKYYENGEKQEIKNYKKEDRVILSIVRLDSDFTVVQHKKWNEKGELIFKKEFE